MNKNQWMVIIYIRSMRDFVTSNSSSIVFRTYKECEDYIESSEKFHPNRFWYQIKEYINER